MPASTSPCCWAARSRAGSCGCFMIYSAGNFIEATPDTPFLQIGEPLIPLKPILDRAVKFNTDLYDALKGGWPDFGRFHQRAPISRSGYRLIC